jgi:predicted TIM-barrel fold metal-dependent hydrolase
MAVDDDDIRLHAVKVKLLGLNAARLWGLDPHATRCARLHS